ncbi:MAG: hypothetical protein PVF83_11475 [Anaerolineales bacterium]
MKTLKKVVRVFVIIALVVSVLFTSITIDVQASINIGNQQLTFQFSFNHPEAASPLYFGCCGSGNGTGPG